MPKQHTIKTRTSPVTPAGQQRRGNRWAMWAQTLRQRHGRIAVRHRALAFILTRNQAVTIRQIERWHHTSSQLLPKIRLAIGPFFFSYSYTGSHPRFLTPGPNSFAWLSQRFNAAAPDDKPHSSHEAPWSEYGGQTLPWRQQYVQQGSHAPSLNQSNVFPAADRYLRMKAGELAPRNPSPQSAFMRVFARLDEAVRNPLSFSTRFETKLIQRRLQLINRVINGRLRNEDSRRSLVSREHREYSRVITNVSAAPAVGLESPRALPAAHTSSAQAQTPGGWSLDIERLTDQVVQSIDGRIAAHRERTGRVF